MRHITIHYTLTLSVLLLSAAAFAQNKPTEKPATQTTKPAQKPAAQNNKPGEKPATQTAKPGEKPAAQPTKPTEKAPGALTEEIVVERPYKPVLADASKIRRSPDLNSARALKSRLNYSILDKKLEINSDIRQLQAQEPSLGPVGPATNNYAKLGLGNFSTGLAEVYINTGADEALQAGVYAKHLNQEGSLAGQQFSRQNVGIFGKSVLDKVTLNGELGFDRYATNFYGVRPDSSLPFSADPAKQRYGTIRLQGELVKNYTEDAASDYALKVDGYLLSDKFDARENAVAISGFFNKVWKQFNIGVNTSVDLTRTKDSLSVGNHIFRANPYIKLQGTTYKVALGVNIVQEFGTASRFNFFPAITAEVPLVPEIATLFGGFTGDVHKSTLRDFANDNPYINRNITIENALEKTYFYGGIKGNAGAGFGYKAMLFYKKLDNMALYRNDMINPERFNVIYDDAKITGLEGEVSVKVSEAFNWSGKININSYSMDVQEKAWFMPDFRLTSNARVKIMKKLTIDGEVVINDQTSALVYPPLSSSATSPEMVKIKSYVDLSAGAEYLFRDKIGIFLRANNLFGNKYQRFLYYPKTGLNIIGGVNYSF